jgi:hypothetical protein
VLIESCPTTLLYTPSTLPSLEDHAVGKTLPPFSQLIEYERRRWAPCKRTLAKEEQAGVDKLFDCAKLHIQAGVMVSRPWPFETMVMTILLEHEKRIEHLMRHLEQRVPSTESWHSEKKERPRRHGPGYE